MTDEDIRRLLDDAVDGVHPSRGLDAVRARTGNAAPAARHRALWVAGAAVLATAATVLAVTFLATGPGARPTAGPGPGRLTAAPTEGVQVPLPSGPAGQTATAFHPEPVYYVGDTSHGPRLFRELHDVRSDIDAPVAAVREALSFAAADPDYRSPWPEETYVDSVRLDGDVIDVDLPSDGDLSARPPGMSRQEASMALQQLVYTAEAATARGRQPVQFLLDGRTPDSLLGLPTSRPVPAGRPAEVLSQVWVVEPANGAKVHSGFGVSGLADASEATVTWQLRQGDAVVRHGFTTAGQCCTMAPYSFTVQAPPGDYTLVVRDTDPSGGEGFAPWQDTKQLTVIR
jgi:hypothetical protein